MKKLFAVAILFSALAASADRGGNFGAGFVLGDPTGFDFKLWTVPQKIAWDFNVGWGGYWGNQAYGYTDSRCYDNGFYNANTSYCLEPGIYNPAGNYGWGNFHLHADYLIHNFRLIHSREKFGVYYGPGVALDYWRSGYYYPEYNRTGGFTQVGVRGVLGLTWLPRASPFDLFVEIAPVIELFPFPDFRIEGGFGGRYYF